MKIAYTFHGHSRSWQRCYKSFFENVYSVFPGDIFIHTWDRVNMRFGSWWNGWVNELEGDSLRISEQLIDFTGIYNAYNPKKILVEPDRLPDISKYFDINSVPDGAYANLGTKNMLYSEKQGFEMATSYGEYDKIFSTRMDVFYHTKMTEDEFLSDALVVSNQVSPWHAYDIWMLGDTKTMRIKSDYYHHIDTYWFERGLFSLSYENQLLNYLHDNNINNFLQTKTNFSVERVI